MYVAHKIRDLLSLHLSIPTLKRISFSISLISCLVSGSILLFTLYTPSFHKIGLSYLQINLIASLSAGGMYFILPLLGYLADCYGPSLLSLLLIIFFVPSYLLNSFLVVHHYNHWQLYSILFGFIGIATSSLYFASLLTCARIYPDRKGLAISLPITCYGLSALIGSQFVSHMELNEIFIFFAILYLIVGIFNFIAASTEQEVLLETESLIEPRNHKERYVKFLKDKSAYIFLISFILNIGPLESYQNNLSTINPEKNLSNQVGIFATSSTISRLIMGGITDYLSYNTRKYILILIVIFGFLGQWFNNLICNGIAYGGLFTIYPTIIASKWGIDIIGSTWGSFMVAPAIGSIIFSLLYGKLADLFLQSQYFIITSSSILVSCLLIIFDT